MALSMPIGSPKELAYRLASPIFALKAGYPEKTYV